MVAPHSFAFDPIAVLYAVRARMVALRLVRSFSLPIDVRERIHSMGRMEPAFRPSAERARTCKLHQERMQGAPKAWRSKVR